MNAASYTVRPATTQDADRLRDFACAPNQYGYEEETERFIREDLIEWVFAPGAADDDPRGLVLLEHSVTTVAVAAHERGYAHTTTGDRIQARHLQVVAVATTHQGQTAPDGNRWSDIIVSAALIDALDRDPVPLPWHATVHRNNTRSEMLLKRHGLTVPVDHVNLQYVDLVTETH